MLLYCFSGARFALLQTKTGLASIISNFKISVADKTKQPVEINYASILQSIKGIVWFNIEKTD